MDSKAREAAHAAAAHEMFRGKPGQWTGSGPGNVANAAIDAYIAARREEGFVEVPREPTEDMWRVGDTYLCDKCEAGTAAEVYRAMLKAAEQPPTSQR